MNIVFEINSNKLASGVAYYPNGWWSFTCIEMLTIDIALN